jgi:TetR/AcrR family transcriptional regulator, tetracycline repressor protein
VPVSRARGTLNRHEIGAAALALVDELGPDALTMRSLAKSLRCDPMSLYRHVDDRVDLLALVATAVIAEISAPDPSLDDAEWLRQLLVGLRNAFIKHQHAVPIIGNLLFPLGRQSEVLVALIMRLTRNRSTGASVVDRYNMIIGATVGYLMVELAAPVTVSLHRFEPIAGVAAKPVSTLSGKAFGFRPTDSVVLLPKGFQLLGETLIAAVLDPPSA